MRSFAIAALVGTVTASPAYTFATGEAPHCLVLANGATSVHYSGTIHPSFKCSHTSANTCVCSNPHPTHHTGGCKEFDHTDGTNHKADGDCTDSGLNAIDGAWSGYTYGACSKSCGGGDQSMTRACDSPAPFNGGADCAGSTTTSQTCNSHACPTDGTWSDYTYGACSTSCGDGSQSMTRTCNGRANGGADCAGSTTSSQSCNSGACPVVTCLSAQTGTTSMTLTGFDGTKNLAGKNNLDFVHLEGDKYMIKDGTKCLIFGGNGNNKNPQFYNWGGSDEHCGFPDQGGGSKASLLANGQAIFDVIHLEDDKYLIKYAEDGPGGGGKCLIYGNSGKDTSVQRYLWNANAAYADTCGFSTVALVVANRQAVFTLNC
jgi:hypothetical protein